MSEILTICFWKAWEEWSFSIHGQLLLLDFVILLHAELQSFISTRSDWRNISIMIIALHYDRYNTKFSVQHKFIY